MWDEFVIGGEVQETSKKNVLKAISDQDMIQEVNIRYSNLNLAFNCWNIQSKLFFFFFKQEETPQGFFDDQGLG